MLPISFNLNGKRVSLSVEPNATLLQVLRDQLNTIEVKYGCGEGVCGTCTVLLDGESVSSCLVLAVQADGAEVTTLRGIAPAGAELHPLQEAFLQHGASQCGFCTMGMIMTAYEFLQHNPQPTRAAIRHALEGNLCRCTGYVKIIDAVEAAALRMAEEKHAVR